VRKKRERERRKRFPSSIEKANSERETTQKQKCACVMMTDERRKEPKNAEKNESDMSFENEYLEKIKRPLSWS